MAKSNSTSRATPGRQGAQAVDATALLRADHKAVDELFKEFEELKENDADDEQKGEIAQRICAELTVHAQIEEEIFYPALRQAIEDQDLLDEAEVEHGSLKELIAQLQEMEAGDELFDAKLTVLGEYVTHHVEEEQNEIFPAAKTAKVDLLALGAELKARKEELSADLGLVNEDEDEEDEDDKADEEVDTDEEDESAPTRKRAAGGRGR